MHKKLNVDDFRQAFKDHNRSENFSYEGLELLFDYFEQYEEECNSPIELDVIAICCEYSEMTKKELLDSYNLDAICPLLNIDWFNNLEDEEQIEILQDGLEENTFFIGTTKVNPCSKHIKDALQEPTFVFQSF